MEPIFVVLLPILCWVLKKISDTVREIRYSMSHILDELKELTQQRNEQTGVVGSYGQCDRIPISNSPLDTSDTESRCVSGTCVLLVLWVLEPDMGSPNGDICLLKGY